MTNHPLLSNVHIALPLFPATESSKPLAPAQAPGAERKSPGPGWKNSVAHADIVPEDYQPLNLHLGTLWRGIGRGQPPELVSVHFALQDFWQCFILNRETRALNVSPKLKSIKRRGSSCGDPEWDGASEAMQFPPFILPGRVCIASSELGWLMSTPYKGHPPIPIWSTLWQPGLMFRRCCLENAHSIHFSFDTHTSYSNANRIYHLRLRENLKSGEEEIYSSNFVSE